MFLRRLAYAIGWGGLIVSQALYFQGMLGLIPIVAVVTVMISGLLIYRSCPGTGKMEIIVFIFSFSTMLIAEVYVLFFGYFSNYYIGIALTINWIIQIFFFFRVVSIKYTGGNGVGDD